MKASGQTKILTPTPISVVGPTEEVTIAQLSAKAPLVPYAAVARQQPSRKGKDFEK